MNEEYLKNNLAISLNVFHAKKDKINLKYLFQDKTQSMEER